MDNSAKLLLASYRLLLVILLPLILIYTLYRTFKDGGLIYFQQRFGFNQPKLDNSLWFHCASVGEVNTAIGLITLFVENMPQMSIVISTNTPTGKEVLLDKKTAGIKHCYLPLDYSYAVKRTLKRLNPEALLMIETEIWPTLIQQCADQSIKVILYNARLTEKTLRSGLWLRKIYSHTIRLTTKIFSKSEQENKRYIQLGAAIQKTVVIGSLKFSNTIHQNHKTPLNYPARFWLAASTHADEEVRICKAWMQTGREELLIFIPRYPERGQSLRSQITNLGLKVQLISEEAQFSNSTQVLIVDMFGEMRRFMSAASVVFVGGSLIERGGQNIIEPSQLAKVVIVGPDISNFSCEFDALRDRDAIVQVSDEYALVEQVEYFLDNPDKAKLISDATVQVCQEKASIAEDYYRAIVAELYPANK